MGLLLGDYAVRQDEPDHRASSNPGWVEAEGGLAFAFGFFGFAFQRLLGDQGAGQFA